MTQTNLDNTNTTKTILIGAATVIATMGLFFGGFKALEGNGMIDMERIEQIGEDRKALG